ncbi:MAG: hypothetical protein EXS63_05905 [Candidatus Omnitrophica bacterium]|nr:hypothetical protein [Candidatus Omnitrophota bacterium]
MSLIQQALERAGQTPHTTALERERVAVAGQKARAEEEAGLQVLEKKIKTQEIAQKQQRFILKGVFIFVCLAAILGGVSGIYFWIRSYSAASPAISDVMSASVLSPMIPLVAPTKAAKPTKLSLTGITSSGGVRYALINNEVVTIGDMLKRENVVIKDIYERSVVVEQNGRPMTLSLDPSA